MMAPLQMLAVALAALVLAFLGGRLQRGDVGMASGLMGGMLLFLAVIFRPSAFADYWPHVWMVDNVYGVDLGQLVGPEMVIRSLFAVLGRLFRRSETVVDLAATLLLASSVLGLNFLARRWAPTPANLAIVVALFGPLLVFVLIRASFAYLLVAFVILRGPRPDKV